LIELYPFTELLKQVSENSLETNPSKADAEPLMAEFGVRSPTAKVGGLVYFGRMLDKIRLHATGELPPEYQANLGKGFDKSCLEFLSIEYPALTARVKEGGSDDEILEWCFAKGRRPTPNDIAVWNEYMRKRAWNDELSDILARRKKESGFSDRSDIQTMFQYIDADEGR
jgi:hypothetical protein